MLQLGKKKYKVNPRIVKFLKDNKSGALTIILLGILADIFFISTSSDVRIFTILGLSIFSIIFYKLSSRIVFFLCLGLLLLMFGQFIVSGTSVATEKTAVWFVLFFGVGIIRQWKE